MNRKILSTSIENLALCLIAATAALPLFSRPALAGEGTANNSPNSNAKSNKDRAEKLSSSKQFYMRGLKETNDKNWADAAAYYTEAINLDSHYGEAYGNRGAARFNLGDYNGALSDYNAAIKIFPDNKALIGLKTQVESVLNQNASSQLNQSNQTGGQTQTPRQGALSNQMRAQMMLGGDLADPSTIIMMNAQRRGLITQPTVDYSDPASIIMMNARKRGLVPPNTPSP